MNLRTCIPALILLWVTAAAPAAPGTIETQVTTLHNGPIRVGDVIEVTLRLSGYTDPVEIDGFNLKARFDGGMFEFVPEPADLGDASGRDQQWLSKPNQESQANGFDLTTFIDASIPGELAISVADLGFTEVESGTVANSGFLIAFRLVAIVGGTSDITLEPSGDGSVLFDTALSPMGVPGLRGASKLKVKKAK